MATAGQQQHLYVRKQSPQGGTDRNAPADMAEPADEGRSRLPVRMLHDRVLVDVEGEVGERRSGGGIVIPATASVGRRLSWGAVAAIGPNVRQVQVGDRVLFDPEDRAEVEIGLKDFLLLRERDLHAVAAGRVPEGSTGLYL